MSALVTGKNCFLPARREGFVSDKTNAPPARLSAKKKTFKGDKDPTA